jgi:hypothetical protein
VAYIYTLPLDRLIARDDSANFNLADQSALIRWLETLVPSVPKTEV